MELWYIILFVLLLLIIVGLGAFFLFRPKYKKFRQCKINGVLWRWKWGRGGINSLECVCETCDGLLVYDDEAAKSSPDLHGKITFFICPTCNNSEKGRIYGGDRAYAHTMIKREIQRMISTNEYLKWIK